MSKIIQFPSKDELVEDEGPDYMGWKCTSCDDLTLFVLCPEEGIGGYCPECDLYWSYDELMDAMEEEN